MEASHIPAPLDQEHPSQSSLDSLSPKSENFTLCAIFRRQWGASINAIVFPPSSLPALEVLVIEHELDAAHLFSTLFSDPSSHPSLKTLAFLDCNLTNGFMENLTRFTSSRKDTVSAWLYWVVIVNSDGNFPGVASINALQKDVSVVDVRIGMKLPTDLT